MPSFPEIAYPEPGWISRFVGRTTQLKIVDNLIASTDRGVVLPIVQVIGRSGVGKSWFLQRIKWQLRNSFDTPVVLLRFSNPAMAQIDRAADALMSRLINRWRISPRLTEFVLGRIADLRGENFERFATYAAAHRIIPSLENPSGEKEIRRVLIERGTEHLRRLWGENWGKRFLRMSPTELAWYLPDLLGIDIDEGMRTLRYKTFVLLADDVDRMPALYQNMLRLKRKSSLTLLIMAAEKPFPTGGHPVETIPLDPLPLLERRAYFYLLGIDSRKKQSKIVKKYGDASIDFAIGAVEEKQIFARNPALKRLLGTLLICHRPSLEVVRDLLGDTGTIASFFAEPALVDLLEHPDRLPWRFALHPRVRRWALSLIDTLPVPEKPCGDTVNKLALFANRNFKDGIGVIYWFFRYSLLNDNLGDAVDAMFCANEVAENANREFFRQYNKFLCEVSFAPVFNKRLLRDYIRQLILSSERECISCLLAAAHLWEKVGQPRYALWTARGILPKISGEITGSGAKKGVFNLLRAEAHRIIANSLTKLGNPDEALIHFSRARDATYATVNSEPALTDEATIQQIQILRDIFTAHILNGDRKKARESITKALDLAYSLTTPSPYKQPVALTMCEEVLDDIYRADMLEENPQIFKEKIESIIKSCEQFLQQKENFKIESVLVKAKLFLAIINFVLNEHQTSIELAEMCDELVSKLGEKARWRSDYWRRLSIESKLIQAENYLALEKFRQAFDSAQRAQEIISIWNLENQKDLVIWSVKARILGGIALSRLGEKELAHTWLSAGISLAEKTLSNQNITSPVYFNILCGEGYRELARIELERKSPLQAESLISRGIEHLMEVISHFDPVQPRFAVVEMYTMLMEIQRNSPQKFWENFENAVAMLIAGCRMCQHLEPKATELAEKLFELALKATDGFPPELALKIKISALGLYPFLRDSELIKRAYELINSIDEDTLPPDARAKFNSAKKLAEEFKRFEINPGA